MALSTRQYLRKTEGSMARLRAANESLAALLDEKRGLLDRLEHHHVATIRGLARAIDAKDPYTAGHTERVARYCVTLAVEMGLDEPTVGEIEHGAILHDIGKIGVPDAVLTKPSALAPEEWAQMRRHPEIACEILAGLDLSQIAMDVIRSHHENVDGTGYPDGLAGSALSLPARIARVADAFDAMTSDRPYRAGMAPHDAVAELERCAGTQFSPDVVRVMKLLVWRGELETPVPRRLRRAS